MSDLARFQHPRFAKAYQRIAAQSDARGGAAHRQRLLGGLSGRVIEVGAGNGRNFAHYPATVTEVVAVEPEDRLRAFARHAAVAAPVPITVLAGHADALPADDQSCNAAVVSLVLCSVPDPAGTLAEIRRVLRPNGQLRVYEHVRSAGWRGRIEDVITPIWSRAGGGCHPNRNTAEAIREAGFTIDDLDRFMFRFMPLLPAAAHILGTARRPSTPGAT
ncbi:MAG: SAM-dependent methyltransferase [Pseudonocardiales bacterium]|nr:MAG: SAM-dependent methyltransferase [Pseudonocardiales bacterium]